MSAGTLFIGILKFLFIITVLMLTSHNIKAQLYFQNTLNSTMDPKLIGNWTLSSIEMINATVNLKNESYYLKIKENGIAYKLDVNTCFMLDWIVKDQKIIAGSIPCTRICCDERYESLHKLIDYVGEYKVLDSLNTLMIINHSGNKMMLQKTD